MNEYITYISEYSKFRVSQYLGCPNGCFRTLAQPHLAINVNCLLTLFKLMFANGLRARTDLACLNALISVVPAANDAVPGTIECSECSKFTGNSSCINQCL
jgi:hypothetical protein